MAEARGEALKRVMVTGGRDFADRDRAMEVLRVLVALYVPAREDVELIHGAAPGADTICEDIAAELGWGAIPFPADWFGPCVETCAPGHRKIGRGQSYCPAAGPRRNAAMVASLPKPVVCIAFPTAKSVGTWDAVSKAKAAGIPQEIVR